MSRPFFQLWLLTGAGIALLSYAHILGYIEQVYKGDASGISYVITALFIATLGRVFWDTFKKNEMEYLVDVEKWLVTLGLIANVVGFILALRGMDASAIAQPDGAQKIATHLIEGMSVAFYGTLVGAIGALWIDITRRVVS